MRDKLLEDNIDLNEYKLISSSNYTDIFVTCFELSSRALPIFSTPTFSRVQSNRSEEAVFYQNTEKMASIFRTATKLGKGKFIFNLALRCNS